MVHSRRFFQYDVSVRAADTKRANARPSRRAVSRPFAQSGVYVERTVGEINLRVRTLKVQARRQLFVLEGQHRLDKTRDSGSRVQMSQVSFD